MQKLILLIGLTCAQILNAQRTLDLQAYWEKTKASQYGQNREQQILQGKVKEVVETYPDRPDSLVQRYNPAGWLVYEKNASFVIDYQYNKQNKLQSLEKRPIVQTPIELETWDFDQQGRLEKVNFKTKPNDAPSYSKNYQYEQQKGKFLIKVSYQYDSKHPQWGSYILNERYEYSLDQAARPVSERSKIEFSAGDSPYISSKSFEYDKAGKLVKLGIADACCGSNSCLCVDVSYKYDGKGRLIQEILQDHTIRNAVWSYSYTKSYQYDEKGNRSELYKAIHPMEMPRFELDKPAPSFTTDYQYDAKGNWIERWQTEPNTKKRNLVASRRISYYE